MTLHSSTNPSADAEPHITATSHLDWQNIQRAAGNIDPSFTNTPLVAQPTLDEALGCRLTLKVETLGPLRSFKGRGADWYLQGPQPDPDRVLVTASAGNFGQAVAYAGARLQRRVVVFSAVKANPLKVAAMRRWGAHVELVGADFDAAMGAAVRHAEDTGAELIVDGAHSRLSEGAGTIAYELVEQHPGAPLANVVVPLGNGALVGGVGSWLRHAWPTTRVTAVVAAGAPAMARSWRARTAVETTSVNTIADGIAIRIPVPYALEVMRGCVDEVVEVEDHHVVTAMRLVHRHLGLVAEPAGVAGIAAIVADPAKFQGQDVGSILCGANIDPSREQEYLFGDAPAR